MVISEPIIYIIWCSKFGKQILLLTGIKYWCFHSLFILIVLILQAKGLWAYDGPHCKVTERTRKFINIWWTALQSHYMDPTRFLIGCWCSTINVIALYVPASGGFPDLFLWQIDDHYHNTKISTQPLPSIPLVKIGAAN